MYMYNILNNLIRICSIMHEIFKKKSRFDLLKVLYGVTVKLLVLLLFGYEHVHVQCKCIYFCNVYTILFNVFIIDFNMILTLTCVLLNYTNIQMQSPLFSSESFPIDFTVISYTHFFHFFFSSILHFTLLSIYLC